MDSVFHSTAARRGKPEPDDWSAQLLGATVRSARRAGWRLARVQRWVVGEALENYPLATLGATFGLGVITGWLVKRR